MLSADKTERWLLALGVTVSWACQRLNPPSTSPAASPSDEPSTSQASPRGTALSPPSAGANSQALPNGEPRQCVNESDCEPGSACVSVDQQASAKACASLSPPQLAAGAPVDLQASDLNRWFVFRKHKIARVAVRCTLLACARPDGTPVECCNRCVDVIELSGFRGVPIFGPDRSPVRCASRLDCEPSSCPAWLELGVEREIVGSFRLTGYGLSFVLANGPPTPAPQPGESRDGSPR